MDKTHVNGYLANPFTTLQLSLSPEQFTGRRAELDLVIKAAGATPPVPLVIQGPRWIGKTSLLRQVAHVANGLRVHWVDCAELNLAGFYRALLETVEEHSGGQPLDVEGARQHLQARLAEAGPRRLFILDHFDHLSPIFEINEQRFLRSLMAHQAFALGVEDRFTLLAQEKSPLLGIFTIVSLKPFSPGETRDFLQNAGRAVAVEFAPAEVQVLHELSGGHPYLLTLIAGLYFDLRQQYPELSTLASDPETVAGLALQMEALPKVQDMFTYYLGGCTPAERALLLRMAAGQTINADEERAALQSLNTRLLVTFAFPNRWHLFSRLFADYLKVSSTTTRVLPPAGEARLASENLKTLTQNERKLLGYLMKNADRVCSFEELSELLWSTPNWNEYRHSLDATIYRLRLALERLNQTERPSIQSVRGKGYRYFSPGQVN